MRLRFLGAAGEVTGSCYLLETRRARILIDFGAHQGGDQSEQRNRRFPPTIRPEALDAVLLTHAHIDHTGRLPLLAKHEYRGPIHATRATIDLAGILLRDAAYLHKVDAEHDARHAQERGKESPAGPLFTLEDVDRVLPLLRPVKYGEPVRVADGIDATWVEAGHILGSASIHLKVHDPGGKGQAPSHRTIVFSGDLGPRGAPLLRDPVPPEHADVVILESTYGDRDHRPLDQTLKEFEAILVDAFADGGRTRGKILIPAFAVGRTQNLIYHIGMLRRAGSIPEPEVWIDSPMAIETTELYRRHRELFDEQAWAIIDGGDSCLHFPGLRYARDRAASESLNPRTGILVIAASGMCTGGRIVHHLRHNLSNPATHVLMVGFQAQGTTGRALVDGAKRVRIMGQEVEVRARVDTLNGFSAHAARSDLLWWMSALQARPRVLLTHGEDMQRERLREGLHERYAMKAELPGFEDVVEL